MFPADFEYLRADSLDNAIALLNQHQDAKLLAGGHSLIPMLKMRLAQPATLIDIGRITELSGVSLEGGEVRIGALTTHAQLAGSEVLAEACAVLSEAAASVGDPQVRNRGTIGGNIAHADPASDLPAPLRALDARIHLVSKSGERVVEAADFFVDLLTTAAAGDEIITRITVPGSGADTGAAYMKMEHPASGYAVCGAAAVISLEGDGSAGTVRLALNGVAAIPYRASALEDALRGSDLTDQAIESAVHEHVSISEPLSDAFASGSYRAHLAQVWSNRALKTARDRAKS